MIWDFTEKDIKKPTDPKELEIWEDLDAMAILIILDGVRDDLLPHLFGNNTAQEMWVSLQNLFQNNNENRVLVLENKLKSTKMLKGESVTWCLTRLSHVKD